MSNKPKDSFNTEYEKCRKEAGISNREDASEITHISAERIANIESGRTEPNPQDIYDMAVGYNAPGLNNYYCTKICPIGKEWVPEIQPDDISKVTLKILAALNTIENQKNRLIEITEDGKISEDELVDFNSIQETLKKISAATSSLELWLQKQKMNLD